MNNDDRVTLPAPSTFAEAETILRQLSPSDADALWSELSETDAETLLMTLAPGFKPVPRRAAAFTDRPPVEQHGPSETVDPDGKIRPVPHLSEATLLKVLETAPDAIVVIDRGGVIVLVNGQT